MSALDPPRLFGEELFAGTFRLRRELGYTGSTIRQKFTGYERDGETGLDFAQARYHSSNLGRFTSSDPFGGSMRTADPQTFNRYAYVENHPLTRTDPSGLSSGKPVGGVLPEETALFRGPSAVLSKKNFHCHTPLRTYVVVAPRNARSSRLPLTVDLHLSQ